MITRGLHRVALTNLQYSSTSLRPQFTHCARPLVHRQNSQLAHPAFISPKKTSTHSTSSGILFVSIVSVIVVGGAITVYRWLNQQPLVPPAEAVEIQTLEHFSTMSGALLPGRPDNLTAEQEEKLKEFWIALFHVFDIDVPGSRGSGDGSPWHQGKEPSTKTPEKKDKTKRTSVFGKRTPAKDAKSSDGVDEAAQMDGEDKYGQGKEFQAVLSTHSREELRQAFWSMVKMDNPDGLLLRFLRARKWNVQNALVMLMATIRWRMTEVKVDSDIIKRGEEGSLIDSESSDTHVKKEGHDFLEQMRIGKSFLHGTDKDGRPMCFVRVRLHRAGEQSESSLERYTVYTIESARLLLQGDIDTAVSQN